MLRWNGPNIRFADTTQPGAYRAFQSPAVVYGAFAPMSQVYGAFAGAGTARR